MRDVARRAGVSTATVSYVLNARPGVSVERRLQVLTAISELGFRPNRLARSLRKGRSRVLGLILLDIANPFYPEIAAGVIEAAALTDYQVFVAHGGPNGKFVQRETEALVEHRCDGIIFTSLTEGDRDVMDSLLAAGVPCVQAVRRLRGVSADFVGIDDHLGGTDAARHLLSLGHRDIAVLAGPQTSSSSHGRLLGFTAALAEAHVTLPKEWSLECELTREGGYRGTLQLLARAKRPGAIFCGNDMIAMGAIDALLKSGLRVPEDMAVVGYDDMSFASDRQIQLTSVHQPRAEIGRVAVRLLLDRVASPEAPIRTVILPHHLVVRRSSGAPDSMHTSSEFPFSEEALP